MATSSKVQFNLETLKKKALESIDFRIAQKQTEVDSFDDDDAFAETVKEWRAKQEERISDLFRNINDTDDYQLSRFAIAPIPKQDRWDRARSIRDLEDLQIRKAKITAKMESLVPDEDGNIALTKTQLSEFFGL